MNVNPRNWLVRWRTLCHSVALTLLCAWCDPPAVQAAEADSVATNKVPFVAAAFAAGQSQRVGAALGERITVRVEHLADLIKQAASENRKLTLFLRGIPLKGIYPETANANEVTFHLRRLEECREAWAVLLGRPSTREFFSRRVPLSVGLENVGPIRSAVENFDLVIVPRSWFSTLALAVIVFTVMLCWLLATKTELIRDSGPKPISGKLRPYSLARTQMAFWFVLVTASYLFLWIILGILDTVTPTVLALIGIGAGTALGAELQNVQKPDEIVRTIEELARRRQELQQITKREPAQEAELQKATAELIRITPSSVNFFEDILTDDKGISFHRFQMFIWTLILGMIFVTEVWRNLAMPEFSATLLALMGISSGTYLGFMIPEKPASQQSRTANSTGATTKPSTVT